MATKLKTLLGQLAQITAQLREVLGMEATQIVMDSAVLRFELAYEVMCKTLQAHATWQGKLVQSPREALKHGYRAGFITNWDMAEDMILLSVTLAVGVGLFGRSPGTLIGKPPERARELALQMLLANIQRLAG